jgi:DNA-binding transcriptional MerR regulator
MSAILKPGVDSKVKLRLSSTMGALLSIGKVAANSRTTADGYRQYPEGVLNRLSLIRNAQRFGFSLTEIAGFLQTRGAGGRPCEDVRAAAQRMLNAVDEQITELVATRKSMHQTLRSWDRTLRRTPPGRQAHLLEHLTFSPRAARRRAFGTSQGTVSDPG